MTLDKIYRKSKRIFLKTCITEFEVSIRKKICFANHFYFFPNYIEWGLFFFLQMVWVSKGLDEGNSAVLVKGLGVQFLFLFLG